MYGPIASSVYLDMSFIINPWNAEHNYSFRFCHPLKDLVISHFRKLIDDFVDRLEESEYSLLEFLLVRIRLEYMVIYSLCFIMHNFILPMAYDFADIEFLMQDKRGKTGAIHEKYSLIR